MSRNVSLAALGVLIGVGIGWFVVQGDGSLSPTSGLAAVSGELSERAAEMLAQFNGVWRNGQNWDDLSVWIDMAPVLKANDGWKPGSYRVYWPSHAISAHFGRVLEVSVDGLTVQQEGGGVSRYTLVEGRLQRDDGLVFFKER